ncbi:hypothetical protein [Streptomyces fructofermentans]
MAGMGELEIRWACRATLRRSFVVVHLQAALRRGRAAPAVSKPT